MKFFNDWDDWSVVRLQSLVVLITALSCLLMVITLHVWYADIASTLTRIETLVGRR